MYDAKVSKFILSIIHIYFLLEFQHLQNIYVEILILKKSLEVFCRVWYVHNVVWAGFVPPTLAELKSSDFVLDI